MQSARRVYIYLVSFISFMVLLAGATDLLRVVFELLFGTGSASSDPDGLRTRVSINAALLVVGGAMWAIHWLLAARAVAARNPHAAAERNSALRKLMIYGVLLVAGAQIYFTAAGLLEDLLRGALGGTVGNVWYSLSDAIARLIANGLAWLLYWRIRSQDERAVPETEGAATVRRWYFYLVLFATLSSVLFLLNDLLQFLWRLATAGFDPALVYSSELPGPLPGDFARILVGGAFWLAHWLWVQRIVATSVDEQYSALRKVYLFGVILQTVTVALYSLTAMVYHVLRLLFGGDFGSQPAITQIGGVIISGLIYGVFWLYHQRILDADAALLTRDAAQRAAIRRVYLYMLALLGLALLVLGVGFGLKIAIDYGLGGSDTDSATAAIWADQIAVVIALIAVGLPVWLLNWRQVQRIALAPGNAVDRQSPARRVYTYIVLFVGVIALLSSIVWLLNRLFLTIGGEPVTDQVLSTMSVALAAAITAIVALGYHAWLLIGDQRAAAIDAPNRPRIIRRNTAPLGTDTVVLLRGYNPLSLSATVANLRGSAPSGSEIAIFPANGISSADLAAWLEAHDAEPGISGTEVAGPASAS